MKLALYISLEDSATNEQIEHALTRAAKLARQGIYANGTPEEGKLAHIPTESFPKLLSAQLARIRPVDPMPLVALRDELLERSVQPDLPKDFRAEVAYLATRLTALLTEQDPPAPEAPWITELRKELMMSKMTHNFTLTRDELIELLGGNIALMQSLRK
jgi:hypothetical protein